MKEKIKKILKNRILIFILGGIVFGTIGVSAATFFPSNNVTYDNTESGLNSTDVQGAIDELYNECFPPEPTGGNMILDMVDLVASGDGLYEDKYEEDKYTYKGANPNNYITFNGEKAGWRIISIEKSGIIKIVKSDSIGKIAWDSSSTNWAKPVSLNTYLNETYYNNKLTSTAKNMIVSHSFGIGAVTDRNNNLTEQIKEENSVTWTGKVALITLSEFIRGSSNQEKCGTFAAIDNLTLSNADSLCGGTNWMFDWVRYRWFLSPMAGSSNIVFYLTDSYSFRSGYTISRALDVTPALYLSSEVKITGGDGSQSNPYQISL